MDGRVVFTLIACALDVTLTLHRDVGKVCCVVWVTRIHSLPIAMGEPGGVSGWKLVEKAPSAFPRRNLYVPVTIVDAVDRDEKAVYLTASTNDPRRMNNTEPCVGCERGWYEQHLCTCD